MLLLSLQDPSSGSAKRHRLLTSLLIVIVAACLFGLIVYRYAQSGSAPDRLTERLRRDGEANASSTQRLAVFVFETVVAAIILIQSSASWPLKFGIFVALQIVTAGLLASVKSFYEGD
jgi:hypothetical protein